MEHVTPILLTLDDLPRYGIKFTRAGLLNLVRQGRFPLPLQLGAGPNAKIFWQYREVLAFVEERQFHAAEDFQVRAAMGAKTAASRKAHPRKFAASRRQSVKSAQESKPARAAAKEARRNTPVDDPLATLVAAMGASGVDELIGAAAAAE